MPLLLTTILFLPAPFLSLLSLLTYSCAIPSSISCNGSCNLGRSVTAWTPRLVSTVQAQHNIRERADVPGYLPGKSPRLFLSLPLSLSLSSSQRDTLCLRVMRTRCARHVARMRHMRCAYKMLRFDSVRAATTQLNKQGVDVWIGFIWPCERILWTQQWAFGCEICWQPQRPPASQRGLRSKQ
jgi:hypothetical protein